MTRRIELHAHTTCSDGTLTPEALVDLAAQEAVQVLAVTDHDTLAGVAPAQARGAALGVEVLPGIELSCGQGETEVHVLGYLVDPGSEGLRAAAALIREDRRQRARRMLALLAEHGLLVTTLALEGEAGAAVTRSHVSRALVREGLVPDTRAVFARWIGEGCPAYVPKVLLPAERAIGLIHAAGGAAVLAHPGRYHRAPDLEALAAAGLDGLEVYYPSHTRRQVRQFRAFCEHHGLACTGGTDFHTPNPQLPLGGQPLPADPLPALRARIAARG